MILRKKNKKNSFVSKHVLHKLAIISLMSIVMPVSIAMAHGNQESNNQISIKLASDAPRPVAIEQKLPTIIPGDSTVQAEEKERVRVEAEKNAALAAAKLAATKKVVLATSVSRISDPADFDSIYQAAERTYGVDWRILKAVHYVETGCSGSTSITSYAGAVGPMQFLPSTFRAHAQDGNGDGLKQITNVSDAIFTAAEYLRACGYPNVTQALLGYNHSYSYVNKVLGVARSLGYN